ncbi:MAG: extracellular solute-binding protein, partial [Oscillospiraceae bacterium]
DMGLDEYEARMKNDDLTDIVMTWPLDCGSQYLEERLLDLSAMPFTSNYNISKLNEISRDGKLYYLPGPSQIRGIVYNKTLFAEKGWEVPTDFDGFISLCKQIEATGIRSLQLGLDDPEV